MSVTASVNMSDVEEAADHQVHPTLDEDEICLSCQKTFSPRDSCIQCFLCELWSHTKCTGMAADSVKILSSKKYDGITWSCRSCKSFAQKYNKTTLKINDRLDKLEKKIEKVDLLECYMKSIKDDVAMLKNLKDDVVLLKNSDNRTGISEEVVFEELRDQEHRRENIIIHDLPEPT